MFIFVQIAYQHVDCACILSIYFSGLSSTHSSPFVVRERQRVLTFQEIRNVFQLRNVVLAVATFAFQKGEYPDVFCACVCRIERHQVPVDRRPAYSHIIANVCVGACVRAYVCLRMYFCVCERVYREQN